MPDLKLLAKASDLRACAEEVLIRAATFRDADCQQELRKIAATYIKLAERLEQASK